MDNLVDDLVYHLLLRQTRPSWPKSMITMATATASGACRRNGVKLVGLREHPATGTVEIAWRATSLIAPGPVATSILAALNNPQCSLANVYYRHCLSPDSRKWLGPCHPAYALCSIYHRDPATCPDVSALLHRLLHQAQSQAHPISQIGHMITLKTHLWKIPSDKTEVLNARLEALCLERGWGFIGSNYQFYHAHLVIQAWPEEKPARITASIRNQLSSQLPRKYQENKPVSFFSQDLHVQTCTTVGESCDKLLKYLRRQSAIHFTGYGCRPAQCGPRHRRLFMASAATRRA